ncbi:MAG: ornithine carbamoyltransferase [Oscillospiraceae bacterium]|nr:ornithine carbamoyltransferase [Oscillospiraceae bacterium]
MNHLLKLSDLTGAEILGILDLADQLKYEKKHGIPHERLKGKTLGMIFEKSSTRTRVSFEAGMFQLGGHAMFLSSRDIQLGRGETIKATARVLSRYVDGIMIRTFEQSDVEQLAQFGSVPVINGLTDYCHPCQVLADLMTIREYKGKLEGLKMCYIGDGNNMANSLLVGGLRVGMTVAMATPESYEPDPQALAVAREYGDKFILTNDRFAAAKDADVIFTDVWTSMGQEAETAARAKAFAGWQVNRELMGYAKPDVMLQHCLPAHMGEEIAEDVFEEQVDAIYDEAENRLHAQKAVLVLCMENKSL